MLEQRFPNVLSICCPRACMTIPVCSFAMPRNQATNWSFVYLAAMSACAKGRQPDQVEKMMMLGWENRKGTLWGVKIMAKWWESLENMVIIIGKHGENHYKAGTQGTWQYFPYIFSTEPWWSLQSFLDYQFFGSIVTPLIGREYHVLTLPEWNEGETPRCRLRQWFSLVTGHGKCIL